jgi:TonB-linked SusC/RagA family outer membrane protein
MNSIKYLLLRDVMAAVCIVLLQCLCPLHLGAQGRSNLTQCVVRVVDDMNEPVIGAAVLLKGTANGQVVDANGKCVFAAIPSDAVLLATCLGYGDVEVPVSGRSEILIKMKMTSLAMDEVVVVGYGSMRKRDLSGSVAQVKGEKVHEFSSVSVASALQGRVSGVQVSQNSGQPGSTIQIRVRGANSIKGNNEPLWIINGFPGDAQMINSADIESIEILKDASATAIYGSRGANGVVIVTTKGAKEGKVRVDYTGSEGVQTVVNKIDMMNAWEYMDYLNTKAGINGQPAVYTKDQISSVTSSTDWQSLIFRPGLVTDHALNVSGGNSDFQGSMGLSYFNQDGIIKNSGYQRIAINTDLKYNISKYLSANANIIFSRSDRDQLDAGTVIYSALAASPLATPKKENGAWSDFMDQPTSEGNPIAMIEEIQNKWYSNRLMASAGFTLKPVEGLSVQVSANVLNKDSRGDYYIPTTFKENYAGVASISFGNSLHFTSNNIITYDKQIGAHHFNVMGGVTYESDETKATNTGAATGFLSDVVGTYDINAATVKGLPSSSYQDWRMLSFLGRINYNYNDRFLLTVNFRADGSSRYSQGHKWGYFPSAAAAWRLKQEKFLKNVDWVSELKLRAGYGITGSTAIEPYSTLNILSTDNVVFDDATTVAYLPSYTYQSDLMWEQTAQTDFGIDAAFFDYRLKFTADFYYKKTTNLLNDVELPRSSGYTTALRNVGSLSNRGFELQLDGRIIDKAVKWDMGVNFSLNRSRVESLSQGNDIFGSTVNVPSGFVSGQLNLMRVGCPMYVFYGYVEDGYDDSGMIVYKDLDNDGKITTLDRTVIGDPNPDFLLSFNTTVSYKRFSLSAFLTGTFGNDIYGLSMGSFAYRYNYNANAMRDIIGNYWTKDNTTAKYPNMLQNINLKMSDRFVFDGSFIRLKNVEFGYDIPLDKVRANGSMRIYVSGQNLLTFTKYPFWDPDVNSKGGSSSITQGVDATGYPSAKSVTIGCRLSF